MIFSRIQKPRLPLILITLLIALCTTANNLAAAENTGSIETTNINTNQVVTQNPINGATLTDNLIVNSINDTQQTSVITINGIDEVNNPALITGIDRGSVTEDVDPDADNLLEVRRKLNISDSDAGEAAFISKTVKGNYGSLRINTAGYWYYAASNNQAVIQNLVSGARLTDRLIVNSIDSTPHTIVITINGIDEVNNPALITGIDRGSVTEDVDPDADNLLEVRRKLNISDSDAGEAAFISKTVKGNYGSLRINTAGYWYYAASNNQAVIQNLVSGARLTDRLIVNSIDSTPHTIVITINGIDEVNNPVLTTATDNGNVTTNTADNISYATSNDQAVTQNQVSSSTLTNNLTGNSINDTAITALSTDKKDSPVGITLSWVAPAEREDNSALSLSAIAGYNIYYGTTKGQYSNSVAINDGTAVDYTFTSLPAGTYHFVVTTIDTEGRESLYSSEVTIII